MMRMRCVATCLPVQLFWGIVPVSIPQNAAVFIQLKLALPARRRENTSDTHEHIG